MYPHYVTTANSVNKYILKIRKTLELLTSKFPDFYFCRYIQFLILIFVHCDLYAGNEDDPIGARSSGISHASVTFRDGWSCINNQAGLGYLGKPSLGLYFENRYNVKEFTTKALFIAYPFKPGTLALNYKHFGYSKYSESKLGLAYGRKLFKYLAAGVQINYLYHYIAEGYENTQSVTAEIGLISEPKENLFIGFHIFNPANLHPNKSANEQIPTTMRLGMSYLLEEKILLALETVKNQYYKPFLRMGLEIKALNQLFARVGLTTSINYYTVGLGYTLKKLTADISYSRNQTLGYSPQVSVVYNWK